MLRARSIDNILLLIFSVLDLAFGIVSLALPQIEWQICALVSSIITLIQIIRIVIIYKEERKSEIFTLIISICDICTGVLSVLLLIYALKALSALFSGLRVFKATKVAIQSSKALQVSKPITTKLAQKVLPIITTYFIRNIKNKISRGKTMELKKDTFISYLKNNPKTIVGLVSSIVASLACGGATSYGMILGNVAIPLWAKAIIGCVVFLVFGALTVLGTISSGWENNAKVLARQIAVDMGYGNAVEALEQAKEQYDAVKEREAQEKKAKDEAERQNYKRAYLDQVNNGSYIGSLDDYIAEQEQIKALKEKEQEIADREAKETELKNQWVIEVSNGTTELSFEKWKKALK